MQKTRPFRRVLLHKKAFSASCKKACQTMFLFLIYFCTRETGGGVSKLLAEKERLLNKREPEI